MVVSTSFMAKPICVGENAGKHSYIPAISLGFVARTNVQRVGGALNNNDTHNEDFYIVGYEDDPILQSSAGRRQPRLQSHERLRTGHRGQCR